LVCAKIRRHPADKVPGNRCNPTAARHQGQDAVVDESPASRPNHAVPSTCAQQESELPGNKTTHLHDFDLESGDLPATRAKFIQQHGSAYGYDGSLEALRSEFPKLTSTVYLDHAATTLYSSRQLQCVFDDLSSNLYGNPHSQLSGLDCSSSKVEELKALTLQVSMRMLQHWHHCTLAAMHTAACPCWLHLAGTPLAAGMACALHISETALHCTHASSRQCIRGNTHTCSTRAALTLLRALPPSLRQLALQHSTACPQAVYTPPSLICA
jgi:hypothetical protein